MWEPLPLIVYGYATHPLTPARRETRLSNRNRLSTVSEASTDDNSFMRDVVSLEVGDEVYAFEKYIPAATEPLEGVWYRGYVVCTTLRPPVTWSLSDPSSPSSSTRPSMKAEELQQVFIGIFPASHIFVRDELSDAEGRLPDLARKLNGTGLGDPGNWGPLTDPISSLRSKSGSSSPTGSHLPKNLPPRPSIKSGDDTASGADQPVIDEIASALREWYIFMFQYLARRDYKLFHIVREHIEALHLGRRQLLAQTLNAEETINMRRDCVTRLVKGNLIQGLDVIVRHPTWGGLVTVDVEGDVDPRSWVSAIRMYASQVSLAYLNNPSGETTRSYSMSTSSDHIPMTPVHVPGHSAFPDIPSPTSLYRIHSKSSTTPNQLSKQATSKFYHVFLDLRAFVASPCSPGETAELFFSLYKKQGTQFVTEEFCAILNHNGVLARDPSSRIRTLFVDLSTSDIQDPIYLVCRIVRNGLLKTTNNSSQDGRRTSDISPNELTWSDSTFGPLPVTSSMNRVHQSQEGFLHFRRPFGCAVLELSQLSKLHADQSVVSAMREFTMPIYTPTNESSFSMIHQNIITNNLKEYEKSSRAEMLAVSIKFFRGDAQTIVRENTSLLQDIPHTLRLGFPDVVFPGDSRNELYIKLWRGDFGSSHAGSSRLSVANFARSSMGTPANNVQVTVEVKDKQGRTIDNVISQGSGEPLMSQFHSIVFQRCHEPTFGELLKIQLPSEGVPQWHLFFTFRNRSGRERSNNKGIADGNDRPFAFAFQPLFTTADAFVEDGSHTMILYRADKLSTITPEMYLNAPSVLSAGQKPDQVTVNPEMYKLATPLRDTLTVRTSLCSTKFTQNPVLLGLLNWEKIGDRDVLPSLLTKFTFVGEGEIVKFLRDIFDSLFGILVWDYNVSGELDSLVFNALVTVLGIVQDRRFSNFQPVLDVYIEEHFKYGLAWSHMTNSMNRLLADSTTQESASPLRAALKVWHYIFRFIVRSRELQRAKEVGMGGGTTAEHLENTFRRDLKSHLFEVNKMMSMSTQANIGTQTIALQHFPSILPELAKVFSKVELVSITTTFANAVTIGRGTIVIRKLLMYLQIVKGFLFDNLQSRPLLIEVVIIWIRPHFGRYDEYTHTHSNDSEDAARISWLECIRICVTIIAVMLDKLQHSLVAPEVVADRNAHRLEQDNVELLLPLLPRLLESYLEYQSSASRKALERIPAPSKTATPVIFPESYPFSLAAHLPSPPRTVSGITGTKDNTLFFPGIGEIAMVFLVLVLSSPTKHILNFLELTLDIEGPDRFVNLLSQFFRVATSIVENDAFPKSWLNVNILAHKFLIKMMDPVAMIMEKEFIPSQESESQFDRSLWQEAMYMLLKLLSSDQLMIEEFSPQKRRAVWRLVGDIRGEGATILLNLWQALGWAENVTSSGEPSTRYGGYQLYLHSLVGHVVTSCLSHHEQLRSNAVQILYSMIVSEYHQNEHFDDIENELVTRLDTLFMSDSKGNDISRAFFIGQLRQLFDTSDVDEQLRERVSGFLDSVDLFLELLLSVRALPEGEEYADDRVIATLRLMNFIRRIGRDEIYIKYVHQLVNMHLQSHNYVEAALTLKLHSDLHSWDLNSFVGPMEDLGLPQQSQFHRKETLCLLILDYLGKGKAWENAIEICKELAYQHSEVTFNYDRLSEILRHQAALLEHIINDQRYYPDYYRVTFYGSFPSAIKDKRFIYRGYEWEKYGAFCERMLNKHPGAQLLKTSGDPPVDIRFGNDQYIQCTAVTPEPNRTLAIFTNPDVPLPVRTYYEHSDINLFSSSRQVKKTTRDGIEEVWTEKTYFTTEEAFPTVLRRSEVVGLEVVEISPLENALNEVEEKTKELRALHKKYQALAKTAQDVSTNALSMSLNSAVDAPHNSGISSYRQIFFDPDYIARNPERAEMVERLRTAIYDQVRVIDSCLKLHGHLCPTEFIPFHETLEKFYKRNFRDEIRRLAADDTSASLALATPHPRSHAHSNHHNLHHHVPSSANNIHNSRSPSAASTSTTRGLSDASPAAAVSLTPAARQTPLQRHLAYLTRHGMTGVASGPGDMTGSDSLSAESPHNSFVNVGNGIHVHGAPSAQISGASVATSYMGSIGSFGSIRTRLSRFGSLNFGRRGGTPHS